MKKQLNLKIYEKNLNNKFKSIPLNVKKNDTGKIKYLPPYFKEWNNTAYFYNKSITKNVPTNNIMVNKIIKSYFNLLFLNYKYIAPKKKRNFLNDIYISNAKIRYTNAMAMITLYTVNLRNYFLTKYLNYFYYYSIIKEWDLVWNRNTKSFVMTRKNPFSLTKVLKKKFLRFIGIEAIILEENKKIIIQNSIEKAGYITNIKDILKLKFKIFNKGLESYNLYRKIYLIKEIKHIYYQYLIILYKYNYKYIFNNLKFKDGKSSFITVLKSKLATLLNKKIEINVINLKSITYNPDIFTKALATKLRKRRLSVLRNMITIINKGKIIRNNLLEDTLTKNRNLDLLENKYKDLSLVSIIKNKGLNSLLKVIYPINNFSSLKANNQLRIFKIIFDLIKYKNMGGIRLEVKGRLTKRYRADRAVYKLHWKGGLKNLDSSLKGLSSVNFRGPFKSNVLYSISKSKRRIGSFAVKGWISGK